MNNPYDLYSWSKHYREEALSEPSKRHLVERGKAPREPHQSDRLGLVWRNPLALLRGA
jgi:hypothetical protein